MKHVFLTAPLVKEMRSKAPNEFNKVKGEVQVESIVTICVVTSLLPGTVVVTKANNKDGRTESILETQKSSPAMNVPLIKDVEPSVMEM